MGPFVAKAPGKRPPGYECHFNDHTRIAELEAELVGVRKGMSFWADRSNEAQARAEKAEAEVERLRHLGGAPPGVSPSPTPCGCKDEREAAIVHGSGYRHPTRKERVA